MYKNKLKLILLCSAAIVGNCYSMQWGAKAAEFLFDNKVVEGIGRAGGDAVDGIANHIKDIQEEARRRREGLQTQVDDLNEQIKRLPADNANVAVYLRRVEGLERQIAEIDAQARQSTAGWDNIGQGVAGGVKELFFLPLEAVKQQMQADRDAQQAAIQGHFNKEAARERAVEEGRTNMQMLEAKLNYLRDPRNIRTLALGGTALACGVFAAKSGFPLLADYVRHLYANPTLAEDTSLLSLKDKVLSAVLGKTIEKGKIDDAIFEPELAERIRQVFEATKQTVEDGRFFRNILLYGPPGTGKTMIAKLIAKNCGLEYIYFSVASLRQYEPGIAIQKIRELFEFGKKSNKKIMIIMDEAEPIFQDRGNVKMTTDERLLLSQLLTYTGTESRDYIVVAITNRFTDFDDAALSRFGEKIFVPKPGFEERKRIISKYIKDYLLTAPQGNNRRLTVIGSFLNYITRLFRAEKAATKLAVKPDAVNEEMITSLANMTNDWEGRRISLAMVAVQANAFITKDKTLTPKLMLDTFKQKVEEAKQEKELKENAKKAREQMSAAPAA